jgi:hypothetical protein
MVGIEIDGVAEAMDDERKGEGRLRATRETVACDRLSEQGPTTVGSESCECCCLTAKGQEEGT